MLGDDLVLPRQSVWRGRRAIDGDVLGVETIVELGSCGGESKGAVLEEHIGRCALRVINVDIKGSFSECVGNDHSVVACEAKRVAHSNGGILVEAIVTNSSPGRDGVRADLQAAPGGVTSARQSAAMAS